MYSDVLRIDISNLDEVTIVTVVGDIDMESAATLRVALNELEPDKDAYVDMANVRFIDSSGIKVLVGQTQRMIPNRARLQIQNPSRVVRRILTVAGLADHFLEPDVA